MADNLPEPKSRKESYLAKATGMDVTIPDEPRSRLEQYLAAIAEGGGGGGTSDFDELTNRPKYNGTTMTGETDIPASPTVVQTTGTSQTDVMSQKAVTDLLFNSNNKNMIQIGTSASSTGGSYFQSIAIGRSTEATAQDTTAIGSINTKATAKYALAVGASAYANGQYGTALGTHSEARYKGSVGLGAYSSPAAVGAVDIGSTDTSCGYNTSAYRLLTGLYDGQNAHDAVTLGQLNNRLDNLTLLKISQTDYDNLQNKDANTLYVITGA